MKAAFLTQSFYKRRRACLVLACLVLMSACTQGPCPEGNCAPMSGSDPMQTAEQTSAPAPGVGVKLDADAATVSQDLEKALPDDAGQQSDTGVTPVEKARNMTDNRDEKVGTISYDGAMVNASVISTGCTLA